MLPQILSSINNDNVNIILERSEPKKGETNVEQ